MDLAQTVSREQAAALARTPGLANPSRGFALPRPLVRILGCAGAGARVGWAACPKVHLRGKRRHTLGLWVVHVVRVPKPPLNSAMCADSNPSPVHARGIAHSVGVFASAACVLTVGWRELTVSECPVDEPSRALSCRWREA